MNVIDSKELSMLFSEKHALAPPAWP